MSYTDFEQSAHNGHPLELYRFSLGTQQWLYTSADHVVVYGENEYQPVFIKRGGFVKGGDAQKSTLEIDLAASNPLALLFRAGWLSEIMLVTVYRHHYGDTDFVPLWKGRVTGCKWVGSVATITSDSVATLFKRAGLRRVYQVGCPHVLFGAACSLDAEDWDSTESVSEVNDTVITVSGIAALGSGYFTGGMLQYGDEVRLIVVHAGDDLSLVDKINDLVVGAEVTLWPGCAHTVNACASKFDNLDNYGGLPYLPDTNPFNGSDPIV